MPNRLARETSPYLQQHAGNPVDWYPWGEDALQLAREQDKPILLSVGYSACHWCHVMAHESFEDPAIAALMNELYVNIKVDREERPDIDQIYQTAHAMLTRRGGGWPLTMFLTPDQTPFFGGTYFPKTARHGLPGFVELLPQIAAAYHTKRAEIGQQGEALRAALAQTLPAAAMDAALSAAPLDTGLRELKQLFDETDGGIGAAPKFPHPAELEFCLRRGVLTRDDYARGIVRLTLAKMAEGGIYDQLGGGFCRYSVDGQWSIPHFEKMLYDNGPLLRLYTDLWLVDRQPLYARVAADTAAWVMREMQSPDGGYYSSLDADSEHEEGKFYVWTRDEVQAALSADEYAVAAPHYGLDAPPNFENQYWHLRVVKPLAFIAKRLELAPELVQSLLDSARAKLLALREQRTRPGRDEKILVSWNALMVKGMARAARVFDRPEWLASARAATEFIRATLWRADDERTGARKRLLATCRDGKAHLNAYLDDYAFLLDALLELAQSDLRSTDLAWARELAEVLLAQFEDREHGGFFFVSHDHERLILRPKTGHDTATPSGNGVAAFALQRLGHVLGEPRYFEAAARALQAFKPMLERQASAHTSLCLALEEQLAPPAVVILRGGEVAAWQRKLAALYLPRTMILAIPAGIGALPPVLDKPPGGEVNAWVCQGVKCLPPITELAELVAVLTEPAA
ncbi:MAG: thioredoxin domain-containing protein [Pseudomonadota bacterium]